MPAGLHVPGRRDASDRSLGAVRRSQQTSEFGIRQSFSIYLQTIARLKPGVSVEQAQAQMDQIAAALEKAHPAWNKDIEIGVRPLRDHIVGGNGPNPWMLMLLGAVAHRAADRVRERREPAARARQRARARGRASARRSAPAGGGSFGS